MATNDHPSATQRTRLSNSVMATHPHDESIMSPTAGDDEFNQINGHDYLMQDSRAAFAYHRPEIRGVPDPLTHKEAVKKYRQHADPSLYDYLGHMRKMGGSMSRTKKTTSRLHS